MFCVIGGASGFMRACASCVGGAYGFMWACASAGSGACGFTRARSSCVGGACGFMWACASAGSGVSGFDAVSLVLLGVDHLNRLSARAATCMWLARHNACPQSGVFGNSLGAAVAHGTCCCLAGRPSADSDRNLGDDLVDEF